MGKKQRMTLVPFFFPYLQLSFFFSKIGGGGQKLKKKESCK